jgi:phospholipase A-2-activating protein
MEYRLSVELEGHFDVVRHVESLPGAVFSSSSRDCTTRVWKLVDNKEWGLLNLLNPHKQMADRLGISSTHYIPSDVPGFPHSALVTTAYDHTAVVQHPETSEIYYTLRGHSDAVVCATHTPQGDIVTGSVDQTLIVWRNGAIHKRLTGHSAIVWALACLPNGYIVSGSADKTIRIWSESYDCVKTINLGSYVRGLSVVPNVGFLSCGSPDSLKLWSYDGELLYELRGHKDTVYSATSLPTGEIVSSSEDCSVIVWNGTEPAQTLATPSGVWSVAALDNGDIIAACQDRKIRVFTKDETRFISDELLAAYTESVLLASAEAAENAKPKKQVVHGVEYDHLIQVDLVEGQPTVPLGYNDGELPVDAAQRFIEQNQVSPMYLDQITQFIANAMGEQRFAQSQGSNAPYVDPFRDTAVPAQYGTNQASAPRAAPAAASKDPFPVIAPILVESGSSGPVLGKLKQMNAQLAETGPAELVLSAQQVGWLESLAGKLGANLGSQNVHFTQDEVKNIHACLQKWPVDKHFPLLDLLRIAVLYPDFANQSRETLLPLVRPDLEASDAPLSQLMALRVFANAFKWKIMHPSLIAIAESTLETLSSLISSQSNANIPPLAVSLLRNFATLLCETKSDARVQVLSVALEDIILNAPSPDFTYLALYSVGSLISRDPVLILTAQGMGIQEAVQVFATSSNQNVKQAATSIGTIFASGIAK